MSTHASARRARVPQRALVTMRRQALSVFGIVHPKSEGHSVHAQRKYPFTSARITCEGDTCQSSTCTFTHLLLLSTTRTQLDSCDGVDNTHNATSGSNVSRNGPGAHHNARIFCGRIRRSAAPEPGRRPRVPRRSAAAITNARLARFRRRVPGPL